MGSPHRSIAPWRARPERPPHPDESFNGYMAFRAAQERLPTVTPITSLAGTRYGHRPDVALTGQGLDEIGDCLGVAPSVLAERVHPLVAHDRRGQRRSFFGVALDRRLIDQYVRSFSPAALAKSPHHRAIWSIRPLPFCVVEWELLVSVCPSDHCGAGQSWLHTNGVDRCDKCATSLIDAPTERVPEEIRPPLGLLAGLVDPDPAVRAASLAPLPKEVRAMGAGPAFELAVAVAGFVDPDLRAGHHARFFRRGVAPLPVCRAMAEAWTILSRWPEGVETRAAEALARRDGRFGDGNRGATMDLIWLSGSQAAPVEVTDALTALERRLRDNRHLGLDCKAAAAATGLGPTRIAEIRRMGVLPTVFHLDGDRPHPLIEKKAVELLSAQLRGSVDMVAAAMTLGLPRYGVEQLVHQGLLDVVTVNATASGLDVPRVTAASIERLASRIVAAGRACTSEHPHALQAGLHGLRGHKPWGRSIAAIVDGTVRCVVEDGEGPLAARVRLDAESRLRLRGLRCDPSDGQSRFFDLMSKKDAAEVLNLHDRHALPLLQRWPSFGGKEAVVPVAEVLALTERYVSPAEFADIFGLKPTEIRWEAARMGVARISPAGFGRSEVDEALGKSDL